MMMKRGITLKYNDKVTPVTENIPFRMQDEAAEDDLL